MTKQQVVSTFRGAAKSLRKEITRADLGAARSQRVELFAVPAGATVVLVSADVVEAFAGLSAPRIMVGDAAGTRSEFLNGARLDEVDCVLGGKNLRGERSCVATLTDPEVDLDQATAGRVVVEALYVPGAQPP